MCEWVSDSHESARLANPCELRIRFTDVLCPHHVGSAYGMALRTISRRLVSHCRIRTSPLGLRIHAKGESASQCLEGSLGSTCRNGVGLPGIGSDRTLSLSGMFLNDPHPEEIYRVSMQPFKKELCCFAIFARLSVIAHSSFGDGLPVSHVHNSPGNSLI